MIGEKDDVMNKIDVGYPVFLSEGDERIGAVRESRDDGFVLYIENAGEFEIPMTAVDRVHDGKVLLKANSVDRRMLAAIEHSRDAEDPNLVG